MTLGLRDLVGSAVHSATGRLGMLLRVLGEHPESTAVAATAASTGLLLLAWRFRWALGIMPLFARLTGWDVAKHPKRERIMSALSESGGLATRDLQAATGLSPATMRHHLRLLERAGLVRSVRIGRERHWREADAASLDPRRVAGARVPIRRAILEALDREPGQSQAEIARRLRCTRANVHHHVRLLAEANLVVVKRDGRRVCCFRAPLDSPTPRAFA